MNVAVESSIAELDFRLMNVSNCDDRLTIV